MEERELPVGWVEASLEDVVDILDSQRVPINTTEREKRIAEKPETSLYPYFGATGQVGLIDDFIFSESLVLLGEDGVPFHDPLKKKAYRVSGKFWVNNHAHVLKPLTGICDEVYLESYLNQYDYTGCVTGSTRLKLTQAALRKIPISLAPFSEQRRIAAKLDTTLAAVDACRQRLDGVSDLLKRFRHAVLAAATSGELTREWREENQVDVDQAANEVAAFIERCSSSVQRGKSKLPVEPDLSYWDTQIPDSWHLGSVSMLAECLDSQRIPVKKENRESSHGLYPYYGANGMVDMVDVFIFDDELVLVTEDETFYGREKPIAYRSSGKCWVNNHAHVLRPEDSVSADYLCFCLMYYPVLPWLTGTTGRAKLTQAVLNSLPVAIPPQREMVEIVRRAQVLFTIADQLEARLNAARKVVDRLTPALLAKAFRGELVPQDPGDEPASVLLERIRAARQAEAGAAKPSRRGRPKAAATPEQLHLNAAPVPSDSLPPDVLACLLQECGPLSKRALLAASELRPETFRVQLAREQGLGAVRETRDDGQVLLEAAG